MSDTPCWGRVIEASVGRFTAEAALNQAPPLGALVRVARDDEGVVVAAVADAQTASREPGRRPIGRPGEEGDPYERHPHLPLLLWTTFDAVVVGTLEGNRAYHRLPPTPVRLLHPVDECPPEELVRFTAPGFDYLKLLLSAGVNADQAVGACLRACAAAQEDPRGFLLRAGKELAQILATEPYRLATLLRSISPDER